MSAVVAIILAVAIPRQVERHLIEGELQSFDQIVGAMANEGIVPTAVSDPASLETLDDAVSLRLLGSNTVRVKVWLPDGTVAYSDVPELIGSRFPPSEDRVNAFDGHATAGRPDLTKAEYFYERDLPPVHDFYIPVVGESGSVVAVFEVYHLAEPIDSTVGNIKRYVWVSIAIGIGLLTVFTTVLIIANGRALTRRRRLTEKLFGDLVRSQTEERTRIIGSLHDDIGQPLYRIHYGIEDCRARVEQGMPIDSELVHLGSLVQEVDLRLRTELRTLSDDPRAELDLTAAIAELAETTEIETDLSVTFKANGNLPLLATQRSSLFLAAREGVTNARKHSRARSIVIELFERDGVVLLEVEDDGVGFPGVPGLGLTVTRDRLEIVGGGLEVDGRSGEGTRFSAWVPKTPAWGSD
jgi:signal transduction histidine kinase